MKHSGICSDSDRRKRYTFLLAGLVCCVLVFLILNIAIGSISIPVKDVLKSIVGKEDNITYETIVLKIRAPRALAAIVLGGALALSGYLLQTFFHNPIAGPFVLGISSGAKLAVALCMVFFLGNGVEVGSFWLIAAAFAGAMLSMGFVLLLSRVLRHTAMLVVGGIMIGYVCSAVTDLVVTFADDSDIVNLHHWSMGSFSGISWENVAVMTVVVLLAGAFTFFLSKPIAAYRMGEAYAENLGVNIRLFRIALVALSSMLAACVTAFAGPVSFVGIAVPQLTRRIFHTTEPIILIPAGFLGGAAWCLICDLLARTMFAPTEVSISTVTAVFGVPVVMYVMIRQKRENMV